MKHLSDNASTLVQRLYASKGILSRLIGGDGVAPQLIQQLADSQELAAVIPLIDFLFDGSTNVAVSASDAIHRLMAGATTEDLVALDEQVRRWAHSGYPTRWIRLQPGDVLALPKTQMSRTSILGLASFHPSGYVRESAIHQLATMQDGSELPYLLIRLNDWVAKVRQAAHWAINVRLRDGSVEPLLRNLGLVFRLTECGRDDHSGIINAVIRRLTEAENGSALATIILSGPPQLARRCFRAAIQIPGSHVARLVEIALQSEDAVLRLLATKQIRATVSVERLEETLSAIQKDRSMIVRRAALEIRLNCFSDTAVPAFEASLLDRSASVREFARFHLRILSGGDFAALYRQALSDSKNRAAAIAGLGETGIREDAALLLPLFATSARKERAALVRSIGVLAADGHVEFLRSCLTDNSPKVAKEAQRALQTQVGSLDGEQLWDTFTNDHRPHVRRAVLVLLDNIGTWSKLAYMIRAACDDDGGIALIARAYIEKRYNRVFTRPTAEEKQRIGLAVTECAARLDPEFLRRLRFHLED
jgi:HEAT repeat protein